MIPRRAMDPVASEAHNEHQGREDLMGGEPDDNIATAARALVDMEALRVLAEGTARALGEGFFRELVKSLAQVMNAEHAFVAEFTPPQRARTLAYWSNGRIIDNFEYAVPGTPCERVTGGDLCHIPSGVQRQYPAERGIEGYLGTPLRSQDGRILGHLCVLSKDAMPTQPRNLLLFEIFGARAAAELDRLRMEQRLRESELRLQDLFDEAPIAYVHEGLDLQFISANRTACCTLGIQPEEVPQCNGQTFSPDAPDAKERIVAAMASIRSGTDTSGVVLELRRKDNGKPLWIQWWSRPDPCGKFTRSMFLDITERVLMEREHAQLQAQNIYLREEIQSQHNFEEIIGAGAGLRRLLDQVRQVAPTDATALILGETGTGKELIARAIHSVSRRADRPLIKINCAALSPGLIESELFGHERGAFSGAIQRRIGRFELAHRGTLFLDEIGEVPADVQVKLLRVLQEREFERVGGNEIIKTDVRVIAATNRNLRKAILDGTFRADLFYRLNVFPLQLPALRDRREDIPLLVQFFVQRHSPRVGRRIEAIEGETMERLTRYPWPGNIRELENIVERALILTTSSVLTVSPDVLSETMPVAAPADETPEPTGRAAPGDLNQVQRDHILGTLRKTNWVIEGARGAAVLLGMKPATLRHRMKKLGISRTGDSES